MPETLHPGRLPGIERHPDSTAWGTGRPESADNVLHIKFEELKKNLYVIAESAARDNLSEHVEAMSRVLQAGSIESAIDGIKDGVSDWIESAADNVRLTYVPALRESVINLTELAKVTLVVVEDSYECVQQTKEDAVRLLQTLDNYIERLREEDRIKEENSKLAALSLVTGLAIPRMSDSIAKSVSTASRGELSQQGVGGVITTVAAELDKVVAPGREPVPDITGLPIEVLAGCVSTSRSLIRKARSNMERMKAVINSLRHILREGRVSIDAKERVTTRIIPVFPDIALDDGTYKKIRMELDF